MGPKSWLKKLTIDRWVIDTEGRRGSTIYPSIYYLSLYLLLMMIRNVRQGVDIKLGNST